MLCFPQQLEQAMLGVRLAKQGLVLMAQGPVQSLIERGPWHLAAENFARGKASFSIE